MTYQRQTWRPGRAGGTPVSAVRLNHMEEGIEQAHILVESIPAGTEGPPGPAGPQGPPGTRRWYGEGTPETIIGSSPGDEYLDILTGDLYRLE